MSPLGKTWYIPHHGVYHPSKPGKLCCIWLQSRIWGKICESSAPFWTRLDKLCCWSLNMLSTGTSSIHCFCGIHVTSGHGTRSGTGVSKFFVVEWCYPTSRTKGFCNVWTLLGATSSASYSSFVLRRTVVDSKSIFEKAASEVLQKDFYVDDLFKSLKEVKSAKQLAKDDMNMCKAGGFHQQGVTFINPWEWEKKWCQGSRSIRSIFMWEGIGNLLGNCWWCIQLQDKVGWKNFH